MIIEFLVLSCIMPAIYGKPLLPKVIQFSKHVENTTLRFAFFIKVKFAIDVIQFHTFAFEILTRIQRDVLTDLGKFLIP